MEYRGVMPKKKAVPLVCGLKVSYNSSISYGHFLESKITKTGGHMEKPKKTWLRKRVPARVPVGGRALWLGWAYFTRKVHPP